MQQLWRSPSAVFTTLGTSLREHDSRQRSQTNRGPDTPTAPQIPFHSTTGRPMHSDGHTQTACHPVDYILALTSCETAPFHPFPATVTHPRTTKDPIERYQHLLPAARTLTRCRLACPLTESRTRCHLRARNATIVSPTAKKERAAKSAKACEHPPAPRPSWLWAYSASAPLATYYEIGSDVNCGTCFFFSQYQ